MDATRAPTNKRPVIAFDQSAVQQRLADGLQQMGLPLSSAQQQKLVHFLQELHAVNQIHNLTAIRDPLEMVSKHVLDSLSVYPYLQNTPIIDVGAGGGLPSLPLVIAGLVEHAMLIDSVGKKMLAVERMAQAVGVIDQIQTVHQRVEQVPHHWARSQVISRAFASVDQFAKLAGHLVSRGGQLLAMKGHYPEAEVSQLTKPWRVAAVHSLRVPFVEAERCLLVLVRN